MAGTYPDVPSNRIAWDIDGILLGNNGEQSVNTRRAINSDGAAYSMGTTGGMTWVVLFPRLLDISGYFYGVSLGGAYGGVGQTYWSPNTTNGTDGTWNVWGAPNYGAAAVSTQRSNITTTSSMNGVKAVQGSYNGGTGGGWLHHVHLYGGYSVGQNIDRLEIWHPTLDQKVSGAFFDWGDITRSSTSDRTFRVKNVSDLYTANSIAIAIEALTDTTPPFAGSFLFSTGGSFTSTVNIGNLFPGQISNTITVRRATPSNAVLSLWNARMSATAATWT